jgi:Fe-Mn family superoxide dismutase
VKFKEAAMIFGCGWAWLLNENGKLAVTYASNHNTPLLKNQIPLLTIDYWEHVYYLDFQNRKDDYIDA